MRIIGCLIVTIFYIGESQAQKSDNWSQLLDAAHGIGFSLYQPGQPIDTMHMVDSVKPLDDENIYFEFSRPWAERRIDEWAAQKGTVPEQYLLFYDILQRTYRGFFVLDTKAHPKIEAQTIKEDNVRLSFRHNNGDTILENFLWREFMSGRMGRVSRQVSYDLAGHDALEKYELFQRAFESYLK